MRLTMTFGAAALALAFALPAAAETAGAAVSDTTSAAPAAASTAAAPTAAVTTGLAVKDKTGVTIGKVTDVKTDAAGKSVATIQMGADTFAVDTSAVAVDNGSVVVNASQAEIKNMMKK